MIALAGKVDMVSGPDNHVFGRGDEGQRRQLGVLVRKVDGDGDVVGRPAKYHGQRAKEMDQKLRFAILVGCNTTVRRWRRVREDYNVL